MLPAARSDLARTWRGAPGAVVSLTHYAAGQAQHRHVHDHTQVSFLIAGEIQETIGRRCHEVEGGGSCVKLAGVDHENLWGRTGALMLSVRLKDADAAVLAEGPMATWRRGSGPDRRLLRSLFGASSSADVDTAVADLLGLVAGGDDCGGPTPPWIRQVKEALWDGAALDANSAARIAGVHRVHFSRSFARHAGTPFSAYRRHVMLSRSLEGILRSDSGFAAIAHEAGFADQSHMNRAIGATFGISPRHVRAALKTAQPLTRS